MQWRQVTKRSSFGESNEAATHHHGPRARHGEFASATGVPKPAGRGRVLSPRAHRREHALSGQPRRLASRSLANFAIPEPEVAYAGASRAAALAPWLSPPDRTQRGKSAWRGTPFLAEAVSVHR